MFRRIAAVAVVPALCMGLSLAAGRAGAQRPGAAPSPAGSRDYVRATAPDDPTIQRMWSEGMERSRAAALAQVLTDSIGPRLNASPGHRAGNEWLRRTYQEWGITARDEQYGTWRSWRRGLSQLALVAPRVRSLEGMMLAWSPGTGGRPVEGEVVTLPPAATREQFDAWLPSARGKWVAISGPQLSCRMPAQWEEFGTEESQARMKAAQDSVNASWSARMRVLGTGGPATDSLHAALQRAGALGVLSHNWSRYPGIDKIFGSWRQLLPTMDVLCEDYAMLVRMAERGQQPRVRVTAESEDLGEQPVFNTIAEIRGAEKPDEYIILSAHFDSWDGSSGATDNATGTITMLEAVRILKEVYPKPRRTILVGHWGGEEQGLNGSRAFTEDHPEVVKGVHALFNQDNGTGRIVGMSPGGLVKAGPVLRGYLSQIPSEITRHINFQEPGFPSSGGTDNASFACYGVPAFGLNALSWDYGNTTWHTNRDSYDKIVVDDLKNNATLTAMLVYLADQDPELMPRDRVSPLPTNQRGERMEWPACAPAVRRTADSPR